MRPTPASDRMLPCRPARAGARRGFSLIELLVVVAIIAVLAGMLLPAVGMVRSMAMASRCQSNLRQIGIAYLAYAQDTGFYPDNSYAAGVYWNDLIESYLDEDNDDTHALANFQAGRGTMRSCPLWPSSPFHALVTAAWQANSGVGYGSTKNCFCPTDTLHQPVYNFFYKAASPGNVSLGSQRVMVGDSGCYFIDYTQLPSCDDFQRHRGRGNFVFFDGHVEALTDAAAIQSLKDPSKSP